MQKELQDKIAHVVNELKKTDSGLFFCTEWSWLLEKWKMFPWKLLKFFAHNSILTLVFVHDLSWEQLLLGGWGAPCCRALKVMTHFTLSCDGVWVRVVCIQLSHEPTNTAELNLLWHHQQQTLYHLLGFWVALLLWSWMLSSAIFNFWSLRWMVIIKCHLRFIREVQSSCF